MRHGLVATLALALALAAPALAQDAPRTKKKVNVDAEGVPLLTILKKLCAEQGLNFVADTRVLDASAAVTLSLKDADFEEAIETIGDVCDLEIRLHGKIVTVRAKLKDVPPPRPLGAKPSSPLVLEPPAGADPKPAPRLEAPKPELAKPEPAKPEPAKADAPKADAPKADAPKVEAPRPEAAPPPPAPKPSDLAKAAGSGPPPGSALGTVIDIAIDHVKVKERAGEARDFFAPEPGEGDLALRSERIALALRGLKKGDQVALLFDVDGKGRAVITNLIAGPQRRAAPPGAVEPQPR